MSNKKARKTAGTLLKVGGVAALGGLAWKAYQDYKGEKQPAPSAPSPANADPVWQDISKQRFAIADQDPEPGSTALLLVQAMIAAACADGHMDSAERRRILDAADSLPLVGGRSKDRNRFRGQERPRKRFRRSCTSACTRPYRSGIPSRPAE